MTTEFWKPIGSSKIIRHPRWDFFAPVNSTRGVPPPPYTSRLQLLCQGFTSMQWENRTDNIATDWWDQHKSSLHIKLVYKSAMIYAVMRNNRLLARLHFIVIIMKKNTEYLRRVIISFLFNFCKVKMNFKNIIFGIYKHKPSSLKFFNRAQKIIYELIWVAPRIYSTNFQK